MIKLYLSIFIACMIFVGQPVSVFAASQGVSQTSKAPVKKTTVKKAPTKKKAPVKKEKLTMYPKKITLATAPHSPKPVAKKTTKKKTTTPAKKAPVSPKKST
ncbi:MAG: hypothetical protein KBB75_00605 [Candidatus Pacebacteria bacterium]|jgi:hypothetical protein|nr:hypothetical protein [Candidatus Paceibacterota bacterium]